MSTLKSSAIKRSNFTSNEIDFYQGYNLIASIWQKIRNNKEISNDEWNGLAQQFRILSKFNVNNSKSKPCIKLLFWVLIVFDIKLKD